MTSKEPSVRPVASRGDVLEPRPTNLVSLKMDPARGDVLVARFWNGDPACYGAMARVTQTTAEVEVQILTGVLPEAKDRIALGIAELQELHIALDAPLAARQLRQA